MSERKEPPLAHATGHTFNETALARIFHELRDASTEKSACERQGDLVAASPDKVGPSGANIPRLREMFGLARLRRNQR